jgi:lysophospholipase L1-like esterase
MRLLLYILLLFSLNTANAQTLRFPARVSTIEVPMSGLTNVYVGDSYVYGVGASPSSNRWTTLFSTLVGATENNLGANGRKMQNYFCDPQIDTLYAGIIPAYVDGTHGALIIALGLNDAGQNNSMSNVDSYYYKYQYVISYAYQTKGWPKNRMILLTPYYASNYNSYLGTCGVSVAADATRNLAFGQKVKDIGTANPGVHVIDVYGYEVDTGSPGTLLGADGLHFNNTGHAWLADKLYSLLFH